MAVSGTAFQASRTHWQTVLYDALLIHPVAMKLFSLIVIQFSQFTRSSALKHRLTEMLRICSNLVRLPGMTASSNDPLFGDVADVHLHRVKDKEALRLPKDLRNIQIATSPSRHCPSSLSCSGKQLYQVGISL